MSRELKQSDRTALEDLEFPSHLPEDQCIRAVLEVRDYILIVITASLYRRDDSRRW